MELPYISFNKYITITRQKSNIRIHGIFHISRKQKDREIRTRHKKSSVSEMQRTDLKLGGFHGDGDTNKEEAEHCNGSIALPVLGPTVRATAHTPNLVPEIAMNLSMAMISSSAHCL